MKKTLNLALASALIAASTSMAFAADPIEGVWKRNSTNTLIRYSKSGGQFCGKVLDGAHKGKSIGCLSGSNGSYTGTVIAVDEGKEYSGKASINGKTMKLSGCVAKIICKGENWTKQ